MMSPALAEVLCFRGSSSADCVSTALSIEESGHRTGLAPCARLSSSLLEYRTTSRDSSNVTIARRCGHADPERTLRTEASSRPASAAIRRTLVSPIAARKFTTNRRAASPAGSSDGTSGQELVRSLGVGCGLLGIGPAPHSQWFPTPSTESVPVRVTCANFNVWRHHNA